MVPVMGTFFIMLSKQVDAEIVFQIAPDRVYVVRVVLGIIILDEERRAMNSIVMTLPG